MSALDFSFVEWDIFNKFVLKGMLFSVELTIIATVGAIFGYMGGATQANAGLFKNNAAIKKTEA